MSEPECPETFVVDLVLTKKVANQAMTDVGLLGGSRRSKHGCRANTKKAKAIMDDENHVAGCGFKVHLAR